MVCYLICYNGDGREDRGHSNSHRAQESSLTGARVKCWHSKQVTRTIRKRKKEIKWSDDHSGVKNNKSVIHVALDLSPQTASES